MKDIRYWRRIDVGWKKFRKFLRAKTSMFFKSENDERTKETSFLFPNPAYLERGHEMASAIIGDQPFLAVKNADSK